MAHRGVRKLLGEAVEHGLIGDLARKPHIARRDVGDLAGRERASPVGRRSGDVGDARAGDPRQEALDRLARRHHEQRVAADERPQQHLQAAEAADVIEGGPFDRRLGGPAAAVKRVDQARETVGHDLGRPGRSRREQTPFRRAVGLGRSRSQPLRAQPQAIGRQRHGDLIARPVMDDRVRLGVGDDAAQVVQAQIRRNDDQPCGHPVEFAERDRGADRPLGDQEQIAADERLGRRLDPGALGQRGERHRIDAIVERGRRARLAGEPSHHQFAQKRRRVGRPRRAHGRRGRRTPRTSSAPRPLRARRGDPRRTCPRA